MNKEVDGRHGAQDTKFNQRGAEENHEDLAM